MKVAGTSPNVRQCNCNLVKWFLLSNGGATKPEIAEATGFRDQNYFARMLRFRLGKSPSELRRERGKFHCREEV